MRLFLLLVSIINLFFVSLSLAQSHKRHWHEGALRLDEFSTHDSISSHYKPIPVLIDYHLYKVKMGDTLVDKYQVYCYTHKENICLSTQENTSFNIRYQQLVFDIAELHKRKLQANLNQLIQHNIDQCIQNHNNEHQQTLNLFQNNLKTDSSQLSFWEKKIKDSLANSPLDPIPKFHKSKIGIGAMFGINSMMTSNTFSDFVSIKPGIVLAFEIGYKNLFFNYLYQNNNGIVNKYYEQKNEFTLLKGGNISYENHDILLGYQILKSKKWGISPIIGIGKCNFTIPKMFLQNKMVISSNNYEVGVNFEYKIVKNLRLIPGKIFKEKEYSTSSIRLQLYYKRQSAENILKGETFGVCLLMSDFVNLLRLK